MQYSNDDVDAVTKLNNDYTSSSTHASIDSKGSDNNGNNGNIQLDNITAWAEKYRPNNLNDLVGQDTNVNKLKGQLKSQQVFFFFALLLYLFLICLLNLNHCLVLLYIKLNDDGIRRQLTHTLLSGPPGSGKTSAILAACRQLYG